MVCLIWCHSRRRGREGGVYGRREGGGCMGEGGRERCMGGGRKGEV